MVSNPTRTPLDQAEGPRFDRKSLRTVTGPTADFPELAKDCVAFANASGGNIILGCEDKAPAPPPQQRIEAALSERIRKRIGELTAGIQLSLEVLAHDNGGQYIDVTVLRASGVASTSEGRYFLRIGDASEPVVGGDIVRLIDERPGTPWELLETNAVRRTAADPAKVATLVGGLRRSVDRVKEAVKLKSDAELLGHYSLASGDELTNLGVLLVGTGGDRARLGTAPVVQAIQYDEQRQKVWKHAWDDYALSPIELVDAIWSGVPAFRESYEVPDGLLRTSVPAFEEAVVRELLVNALVHRPYTHRGDVFLNLHPDRLEVVNPGRLPLGVTPHNILHASRRRNDGLARVFHDLGLMEREGSGFDMMYEHLLATGRGAPEASEGPDSVKVVVPRRLIRPEVIRLLREAQARFPLNQRERIALGLLAQGEGLTATEFAEQLELIEPAEVTAWIGRLTTWDLVQQTGRTRATRYFVSPDLLYSAGLVLRTTLKRVQPHRLRALVLEDLERYPNSSSSEIHGRVGSEIGARTLKRALDALVGDGLVTFEGDHRWRKYRLAAPHAPGHET